MRAFHELFGGLSRRPLALCVVLAGALAALSTARADDYVFYAGGKAHTLQESTNELGVLLADDADATQARNQLSVSDAGTLAHLEGDRQTSRYRILRVDAGLAASRKAARSLPGVEWVRPVYRVAGCQDPLLSTGELVVRVNPRLTDEEVGRLFDDYDLAVVRPLDGLDDTYVVAPVGVADANEVATAAAMHQDDRTVYAHPNFAALHRPRQANPLDEYFTRQWHLNNTGQDGGIPGADISVLEAWETTLGQGIRVGMLDDSCDVDHEDLQRNYLRVAQDILDNDEDPRPATEGDKHGTAVMGLICAEDNEDGVRGVAPNARFTVTRGILTTDYAATASAFTFARQQDVDVHNNSWGYAVDFIPPVVEDAIRTAFDEGRPYTDEEGNTKYRGMVIVFAVGNEGRDRPGDISRLPTVIAVGSTNAMDQRAPHSNWGSHLDIMAPSNNACPLGNPVCGALPLPSITTTDNTDDAGYAEDGYNEGGLDELGLPNLPNPDYTLDFGGTSAAAPIVAGVAALILSANPELTATQVRVILEHTADQVSPEEAEYHDVTSRSNQYGYGRVNAGAAVEAATQAVTYGGLTWPDRVANVTVIGNTLRWQNGAETQTILIVRSNTAFEWIPTDGATYDTGTEITPGVVLVFQDSEEPTSYEFDPPTGEIVYFGIYAKNSVGRYSWGVAVDSEGDVTDAGPIGTGDGEDVDDDGLLPIHDTPHVTINASPLKGVSPLEVTFRGNALSDTPIASTEWDFGDGSPTVSERSTTHTYTVTDQDEQRFVATFTVTDEEGDLGSRSIAVDVSADVSGGDTGGSGAASAFIEITDSAGSEVSTGFAPLSVELAIETSNLPGEFESIFWDLGDGTTADTVTVRHTYTQPGSFPIQATITSCHASGCGVNSWQTKTPVQFITVLDAGIPVDGVGSDTGGTGDDQIGALPEGPANETLSTGRDASAGLCGAGLITVWIGMLGAALLRRWPR